MVTAGVESRDVATLKTEPISKGSHHYPQVQVNLSYGYRSLSWCMIDGEEECKSEQMTPPLSAVSGRGLLRGASVCRRINLIWSSTLGPKSSMFKTQALFQDLHKMPFLKPRSMLVSGGLWPSNLVSPGSGTCRVAEISSGPNSRPLAEGLR